MTADEEYIADLFIRFAGDANPRRAIIDFLESTPDHPLDRPTWALLLEHLAPDEYRDPPVAERPAVFYRQKSRVLAMRQRRRDGLHLYRPDDVDARGLLGIGVEAFHFANGATGEGELREATSSAFEHWSTRREGVELETFIRCGRRVTLTWERGELTRVAGANVGETQVSYSQGA